MLLNQGAYLDTAACPHAAGGRITSCVNLATVHSFIHLFLTSEHRTFSRRGNAERGKSVSKKNQTLFLILVNQDWNSEADAGIFLIPRYLIFFLLNLFNYKLPLCVGALVMVWGHTALGAVVEALERSRAYCREIPKVPFYLYNSCPSSNLSPGKIS